ncbi:MAG: NUDIX domain-containing protein, partial [Acidobacteriia bacterium]|nr:NUDIX domain-containing protein [Terriglobia bacterium]
VATVIPFYERFLEAFPTVRHLARAPVERVLRLWSGLGYYRRARHLHEAARFLVRTHGARFPQDYPQARSLPGIGDYTARAILSMAFGQPYAVLDGNVARVVARLLALKGNLHQRAFRRTVEAQLDALLARRDPGNFNQALMELGQTICLPRAPRCNTCPLREWCQACQHGNPESFPEPRPRRATESRCLAAALIQRTEKVALIRGLDDGLLPDLWNFPSAFGDSQSAARSHLHQKLADLTHGAVSLAESLAQLRHGITYRSIQVNVYPAQIRLPRQGKAFRWVSLSKLSQGAVSQLARKIADELL